MDCNPPGSFLHGDSPGKNAGVGFHALLQGIVPTQIFLIAGRFFTVWATRETQSVLDFKIKYLIVISHLGFFESILMLRCMCVCLEGDLILLFF